MQRVPNPLLPSPVFDSLQRCPQRPDFRKQHHIEHLAQVAHATGTTRAALKTDDALDRGDVAKAPKAKRVLQISEFFAQLVQVPVCFWVAVGDQPSLFDGIACCVGLRPVALYVAGGYSQAAPSQQAQGFVIQ